jgi:hypothetical protein
VKLTSEWVTVNQVLDLEGSTVSIWRWQTTAVANDSMDASDFGLQCARTNERCGGTLSVLSIVVVSLRDMRQGHSLYGKKEITATSLAIVSVVVM